jgi:endonuclease YncB( thermonuclease family)
LICLKLRRCRSLGEWLVGNGLALDWPHYSHGRYGIAQAGAERGGRGI